MILRVVTALMFMASFAAVCAADGESDTLSAALPEIRVQAGRLSAFAGNKFSPVATIGKSQIRQSGCLQVSEAVSEVPGLYIKNFGGAGGIKIVSLRGATSQQTAYMLDGIKINSAQTGAVDLSVIPLFLLESIDIVRGGASALYGGNSLGGVINFTTRGSSGKPELSADAAIGSFGEYAVSCGANIPLGEWYAGVNAEYMYSQGDFPFEFNNFGKVSTYNRQNSDFRNIAVMLGGGYANGNSELKINILARDSERGIPGAVLQNKIGDAPDRLHENETLASAGYFYRSGNSFISASLACKTTGSDYDSPRYLGYLSKIAYMENYAVLTAKYGAAMPGIMKAEIQTEASFNDIEYEYSGTVKDYRKRTAASVAIRCETDDLNPGGDILINLQAGLRADIYSEGFTALSPVLSAMASAFDGVLAARMQWAHNFRPPNFSELYYLNFGNRNLSPEKSDSYNLGITWHPAEFLNFSADGFVIDTRDQILSVPVNPVAWSAINFARTLSRGIEFSASADFWDNFLGLSVSYTFQETTDESDGAGGTTIPYVPAEILNAGARIMTGGFAAGASADFVGFRYSLPGNNISSILPEYLLINLFASYKFSLVGVGIKLRLDAMNIFGEEYQAVKNYPMPGRQFRLSINGNYEL